MPERVTTRDTTTLIFIAVLVGTACTFVGSMHYWWPSFRQVLFLASVLLSTTIGPVWATTPGWNLRRCLVATAVVCGGVLMLEFRSNGPALFSAVWMLMCPTIAIVTFLSRGWADHTRPLLIRFLTAQAVTVTTTASVLGMSDYVRGPTPVLIVTFAVMAFVSVQVIFAERVGALLAVVPPVTLLRGCAGVFTMGYRETYAWIAGSSRFEYSVMYCAAFVIYTIALWLALAAVRHYGSPTPVAGQIDEGMPV